ncbi:helix-turn-helix domain-containing protein, partial [Streptomyces mexicanus]|uniref:helix-turn-helix domain-containing protein n=1 Tax=Streptomyces mexicanus TaxID=178566 RepID=UPI00191537FD
MSSTWSSSMELGAFLRSRRAALTPEEAGVPSCGPRRVPGLRREELAHLAGISVTYYTRLERGESHQVSDSVLDSLAGVLKLTPDERAYLVKLARPGTVGDRVGEPERLRPAVQALVEAAAGQAAIVVGRRADLLGGNRLGHALWNLPAPPEAPRAPARRRDRGAGPRRRRAPRGGGPPPPPHAPAPPAAPPPRPPPRPPPPAPPPAPPPP